MSLPAFSVRNPVTVNLIMISLCVCGLIAGFFTVREFFPTFDSDLITVSVVYPGAAAAEVDQAITRNVVRELKGIDGVDEISSTSFEGASVTTLKLLEGEDSDVVIEEVRTRIGTVTDSLPPSAEEPVVDRVRPYLPVITVVLFGDAEEALLREAGLDLRDRLLLQSSISRIVVGGTRDPEIHVLVDQARLEKHRLTMRQIGQAVQNSNLNVPGGTVKGEGGHFLVRTSLEESTVKAVSALPLASVRGDANLRLRDVATVRSAFEDRVEAGRFNGKPAILLTVFKTPEQDAIEIARDVKAFVARNENSLPYGLKLDTVSDLSKLIEDRLELLTKNGVQGLILVLLALGLFLDLRVAFWVALGLPVSFLGTLLLMSAFGVTINMISMFGLIVVIGLLVDDAIVVGENVFYRIRQGEPADQAAILGAQEVGLPVVAAVATTVVAFAPLAFLDGRIGTFLKELPLVVIAALMVSLFESFLILPAHLSHGFSNQDASRKRPVLLRWFAKRIHVVEVVLPQAFGVVLRPLVRFRYATLAGILALLIGSGGLLVSGKVPFVLIQSTDADTLAVTVEMVAGTPPEETKAVMLRLEEDVLALPEMKKCTTLLGTTISDGGLTRATDSFTIGQLSLELLGAEVRKARGLRTSDEVLAWLRQRLEGLPRTHRVKAGAQAGGPSGRDIEIRLSGEDPAELDAAVDALLMAASEYDSLTLDDSRELGKREARVIPTALSESLRMTPRELGETVQHALFGFEAQSLQQRNEELKVRVLLPPPDRLELRHLDQLRVPTSTGARIPFGELATFEFGHAEARIQRTEGQRSVVVGADLDQSKGNAAEISQALEKGVIATFRERFPGVTATFEGQKKQTKESFSSLQYLFPAALFLIYAVVAALFRSYFQPVLVVIIIPFGLVGAVVGHYIMGFPITILSVIGLVALSGVIVNDSLVLTDTMNRLRASGADSWTAAVQGAQRRLRPILLTSVTTVCGLAPLMLETSFQAQFLIPLAISLVFGLIAGTFLVPVLVPCLYLILDDVHRLWKRLGG